MGRDGLLGQSDCPDSWRQHFIILIIMRLAWNRINSSAPPRDKIREMESMEITVHQIIVSKKRWCFNKRKTLKESYAQKRGGVLTKKRPLNNNHRFQMEGVF